MPKRKRKDKQIAAPAPKVEVASKTEPQPAPALPEHVAGSVAIDPAVALFAQRHKESIERDKAVQRERAAERLRATEHERLVAAKDAAVSEMKRLNRSTVATAEQKAEAEALYRAATADLIHHETGERPEWAPAAAAPTEQPEASEPEHVEGTSGAEADSTSTESEPDTDTDTEPAAD